jgi:hypothetical protein
MWPNPPDQKQLEAVSERRTYVFVEVMGREAICCLVCGG